MKYTEQDEAYLTEGYKACTSQDERAAFVAHAVKTLGYSKHSIIAKLSKIHVYIKPGNISKVTKGKPQTKEQLVRTLTTECGLQPDDLRGLDICPKTTILTIMDLLNVRY